MTICDIVEGGRAKRTAVCPLQVPPELQNPATGRHWTALNSETQTAPQCKDATIVLPAAGLRAHGGATPRLLSTHHAYAYALPCMENC